jgi:hypothetical protein
MAFPVSYPDEVDDDNAWFKPTGGIEYVNENLVLQSNGQIRKQDPEDCNDDADDDDSELRGVHFVFDEALLDPQNEDTVISSGNVLGLAKCI